MLEMILLVNLAFSVVGFFFILRMWKEVKSRRDYYGENFGIPKGADMTASPVPTMEVPRRSPADLQSPALGVNAYGGMNMEQIAAIVNAMQVQQQPQQQPQDGDLQKLVAAAMAAQNGGD